MARVMKDKLEKTNHKGAYYVMKKASIGLLAVASAAFVIAIPTYIYQMSKQDQQAGLAQETSSEIIDNQSEENSEYESYNN